MGPDTESQPTAIAPEDTKSEAQASPEPDFSQFSKEWRLLGTGTYWSEYEQARFEHALASVTPNILKAMEDGPLFARWSPDIELDKTPGKVSKAVWGNWMGQKEPLEETGISVSSVDKRDPNLRLNLRYSMAGRYEYEPRKLYIIRGKPVGNGLDGEPVLEPTSMQTVLTVPYESQILEDFPDLKYYDPYA